MDIRIHLTKYKFDLFDSIPVLGNIKNLYDIFLKYGPKCYQVTENDHYYVHLNSKSALTCILLTIPGINLVVQFIRWSASARQSKTLQINPDPKDPIVLNLIIDSPKELPREIEKEIHREFPQNMAVQPSQTSILVEPPVLHEAHFPKPNVPNDEIKKEIKIEIKKPLKVGDLRRELNRVLKKPLKNEERLTKILELLVLMEKSYDEVFPITNRFSSVGSSYETFLRVLVQHPDFRFDDPIFKKTQEELSEYLLKSEPEQVKERKTVLSDWILNFLSQKGIIQEKNKASFEVIVNHATECLVDHSVEDVFVEDLDIFGLPENRDLFKKMPLNENKMNLLIRMTKKYQDFSPHMRDSWFLVPENPLTSPHSIMGWHFLSFIRSIVKDPTFIFIDPTIPKNDQEITSYLSKSKNNLLKERKALISKTILQYLYKKRILHKENREDGEKVVSYAIEYFVNDLESNHAHDPILTFLRAPRFKIINSGMAGECKFERTS